MAIHKDVGTPSAPRRKHPTRAARDAEYRELAKAKTKAEIESRRIQNDKCPVCRSMITNKDTIYWPARGYVHRKCWRRRAEVSKRKKYKKKTESPVTIRQIDPETGEKKKVGKKYYNVQGQRYAKYMNSPEWAKKRAEYWAFYGYSCKAKDCEATKDLHVHHHTYDRLGNERLSDLVGLCVPHHDAVHAHHGSTRRRESLTRSTEIVTGLRLQK